MERWEKQSIIRGSLERGREEGRKKSEGADYQMNNTFSQDWRRWAFTLKGTMSAQHIEWRRTKDWYKSRSWNSRAPRRQMKTLQPSGERKTPHTRDKEFEIASDILWWWWNMSTNTLTLRHLYALPWKLGRTLLLPQWRENSGSHTMGLPRLSLRRSHSFAVSLETLASVIVQKVQPPWGCHTESPYGETRDGEKKGGREQWWRHTCSQLPSPGSDTLHFCPIQIQGGSVPRRRK